MNPQPAEQRRERQRNQARRAILDASEALLVEAGYDKFSMRRLAARCGYTTPTIYHYFNDKQGLLHALLEEVFQALLEHLRRVPQSANAAQNMRQLLLEFVRFGLAHPAQYQLLVMPRADAPPPDSAAEVMQLLRQPMAQLAVERRMVASDGEAAGQAIWALMHGLISLQTSLPDFAWSDSLLDAAVDMMLHGLPRPEAAR